MNSLLEDLFKNSAGATSTLVIPVLAETFTCQVKKLDGDSLGTKASGGGLPMEDSIKAKVSSGSMKDSFKQKKLDDSKVDACAKRSAPDSKAHPATKKLKSEKMDRNDKKMDKNSSKDSMANIIFPAIKEKLINVSDTAKQSSLSKESPERLARTVFIGNVSTNVKTSNCLKAFKRVLTSIDSTASPLESIRFRSISFARNVPKDMRKIAYRNKELHAERDNMNAYAVYKTRDFALKAVEAINGVVFEKKHLRADLADGSVKKSNSTKNCIFIGNIGFDVTEETIYEFFQQCGDLEYVRLIRDAKTNIGKGFGYVKFKDEASIELAIKLHGQKVGKRDIRVTLCSKNGSKSGKEKFKEGASRRVASKTKRFGDKTQTKKSVSKK